MPTFDNTSTCLIRSRGKLLRVSILIATVTVYLCFGAAAYASSDGPPTKVLQKMLGALQVGSRDQFIESGTPEMQRAMNDDIFRKAVATYGPLLKEGYTLKYLGEVRKRGAIVHLYCMHISDKRDEFLVSFSVKDELVSGLYIN